MAFDFSAISLAISAVFDVCSSSAMFSSVGSSASIESICERRNSISDGVSFFELFSDCMSASTAARSLYKERYFSFACPQPQKLSSIASWFLSEKSFCGSRGPWKSIHFEPSSASAESGASAPLTNARPDFSRLIVRASTSVLSSHFPSPFSSRNASISDVSGNESRASTLQVSAPSRIISRPQRLPASSDNAPSITLLPAPVSPVTAVKPPENSMFAPSKSARLEIFKNSIICPKI